MQIKILLFALGFAFIFSLSPSLLGTRLRRTFCFLTGSPLFVVAAFSLLVLLLLHSQCRSFTRRCRLFSLALSICLSIGYIWTKAAAAAANAYREMYIYTHFFPTFSPARSSLVFCSVPVCQCQCAQMCSRVFLPFLFPFSLFLPLLQQC